MHSTIPADLLELQARFETWRKNRKYLRGQNSLYCIREARR
ncbi:MAG: hypothetical protein ACREA2_06765 [Blastocatellia bacterium]